MKRSLLALSSLVISASLFAQAGSYPVGSTVSDFTVTDVDGNVHNLYDYTAQGKHVILDFFFDTCGPCQDWQPTYSELHEMFGCNAGDLITLSINNGTDSDAEVIAYEQTYGGPFAHAPAVSADGGSGAVDDDFGVTAYPTFVMIDPNNTMVNNDIWPLQDVNTFVSAFPSGSNINPMPCAPQSVAEIEASITALYPNPTTGTVTATVGAPSTNMSFEVFDVLGKAVLTKPVNITSSQQTLDLSGLQNGHYMVRLSSNGEVIDVEQIVLNK